MAQTIAQIHKGHVGEIITIDPETGEYMPAEWYCYDCEESVAL